MPLSKRILGGQDATTSKPILEGTPSDILHKVHGERLTQGNN